MDYPPPQWYDPANPNPSPQQSQQLPYPPPPGSSAAPPPTGLYQPGNYPPPPGYAPPMPPMPPMGYGAPYYPARPETGSGMAVAGLVMGILCVILFLATPCGVIFGILGLVFSIQGRRSLSRRSLATAGLVLSIIGLVMTAINLSTPILLHLPY